MTKADKGEVIIKLGAEGGSITLYGLQTERGQAFWTEVVEWTLEEEGIENKSSVVDTWEAALQLLDRNYPWPKLRPIFIHPEFRRRIWIALQERLQSSSEPCGGTPEHWREVSNLYFGLDQTRPIIVPTDLRDCLPADRKHHYQDGKSMAEAAKSWVAACGCLPPSIEKVVGSPELIAGHFEYPTTVWGGGSGMTDVMAFVPDGVVAVEAKVNETFDKVVLEWIFERENEQGGERSPPHRTGVILQYAKDFGVRSTQLLEIRYQLLSRTLCAALTANALGRSKAWMVVQSFPCSAGAERDCTNRSDFDRFTALVGDAPTIADVRVKLAWVDDPGVGRRG
jgi:hypothetical protein